MTEDHPLQGQSPYSASKIGADMVAYSYWCSKNLPVTIIRPFNTYGPRQSARAVIPTIITQALTAGSLKLGALGPIRDFTYVDDTVDGFVRIGVADGVEGAVINVGSGKGISIGDLAALVAEVLNVESAIEHEADRVRPERSEVDRLICDNTKAAKLLGWTPRVSLRSGIQRTAAWIETNLGRYKAELFNL
jgi:dTDP-glucose 4,6-dehydratase